MHTWESKGCLFLYQYVMMYTYCSGELMSSIGSLLVLEGSDEPHCAGGFWSRWFFKMAFSPSGWRTHSILLYCDQVTIFKLFHFKISQIFIMPQSKLFLPIFWYSLRFPCESLVLMLLMLCSFIELPWRNRKGTNPLLSFLCFPPTFKKNQTTNQTLLPISMQPYHALSPSLRLGKKLM